MRKHAGNISSMHIFMHLLHKNMLNDRFFCVNAWRRCAMVTVSTHSRTSLLRPDRPSDVLPVQTRQWLRMAFATGAVGGPTSRSRSLPSVPHQAAFRSQSIAAAAVPFRTLPPFVSESISCRGRI